MDLLERREALLLAPVDGAGGLEGCETGDDLAQLLGTDRATNGCFDNTHDFIFFEGTPADLAKAFGNTFGFSYVSDGFDYPEVDGDAGKVLRGAVAGKGVLEGTASGVVGLAWVAEDAGGGREHDEKVKLGLGEDAVEVQGSLDFWADSGFPTLNRHALEYRVLPESISIQMVVFMSSVMVSTYLEYHGSLNDSSYWGHVLCTLLDSFR